MCRSAVKPVAPFGRFLPEELLNGPIARDPDHFGFARGCDAQLITERVTDQLYWRSPTTAIRRPAQELDAGIQHACHALICGAIEPPRSRLFHSSRDSPPHEAACPHAVYDVGVYG